MHGWLVGSLLGAFAFGLAAEAAESYPRKPVRIVTAAPGANLDFAARTVARGITGPLGQPVIVENRSSGVVPMEIVANAPPDGHTILLYGSTFWVGPLLHKTPYDPIKDFAPITMITTQPNVLIVHASLPANSVKDLIALAKARPGELNYASGANGSVTHIAGALFSQMAGVNMVRVSYTSASVQILDVMSGRVQLMFGNGSQVVQAIRTGKVRAIAIGETRPSPLYPDLPTIAAAGLPGYQSTGMTGLFTPARTPDAIVKRLHDEIVRAMNRDETRQLFAAQGADVVASSSAEFGAAVRGEMQRVARVLQASGIQREN